MENQINYYDSDSESEEEYEKCDHEYTIRSKGYITCLSCGVQTLDVTQFVPEGGFEYRVMPQKRTDDLRDIVRIIFEDLIRELSYPQITVENSLERLLETCETYMLPGDILVEEGKRKHPSRVSARPEGLCAALLWREALVHKLPLTMTGFSREIDVPRTTIVGAFKQLDDYSVLHVSKPGRPRKK